MGRYAFFSYDYFQVLSHAEEKRNVPQILKGENNFQERRLTDKIRSNKEIASFIRTLIRNYVFIGYTQSKYYANSIDKFPGEMNTHEVIGQEFDNVIIMMDDNFRYGEDGKLQGKRHPNPDYIFYKLLYQGVSRPREKLCIVVIGNMPLFEKILAIKSEHIC